MEVAPLGPGVGPEGRTKKRTPTTKAASRALLPYQPPRTTLTLGGAPDSTVGDPTPEPKTPVDAAKTGRQPLDTPAAVVGHSALLMGLNASKWQHLKMAAQTAGDKKTVSDMEEVSRNPPEDPKKVREVRKRLEAQHARYMSSKEKTHEVNSKTPGAETKGRATTKKRSESMKKVDESTADREEAPEQSETQDEASEKLLDTQLSSGHGSSSSSSQSVSTSLSSGSKTSSQSLSSEGLPSGEQNDSELSSLSSPSAEDEKRALRQNISQGESTTEEEPSDQVSTSSAPCSTSNQTGTSTHCSAEASKKSAGRMRQVSLVKGIAGAMIPALLIIAGIGSAIYMRRHVMPMGKNNPYFY